MCGRFNLAELNWRELRDLMIGIAPAVWNDSEVPEIRQSSNVAPTQRVPIVRFLAAGAGTLSPAEARWGLIPHWHRKSAKEWRASTINARIETVATAPSYRDAYRRNRCIVPMAGYYEWATLDGSRQPYYVHPSGNEPALLVCGLWTEVVLPDYQGLTCTILTEPATAAMAIVHDRQPVIVDQAGARNWLVAAQIEDVPRIARTRIAMHKVASAVGNVRNDGPELFAPVQ